jgi:hypothetical protein
MKRKRTQVESGCSCGQIKMWNKLTVDEKLERCRESIREIAHGINKRLDGIEETISNIENKGFNDKAKERRDAGDVYF